MQLEIKTLYLDFIDSAISSSTNTYRILTLITTAKLIHRRNINSSKGYQFEQNLVNESVQNESLSLVSRVLFKSHLGGDSDDTDARIGICICITCAIVGFKAHS